MPCPKTEHHKGKASREIPLFPELRPYLEEAFELAEAGGSPFVITRYRDAAGNLRTELLRIIRRAGLEPWERMFHNLRASRQNELAAKLPIHIVCAWIGNSALIAQKHYLTVTDADFEAAAAGGADSGAVPSDMEHLELSGANLGGDNLTLPMKNGHFGKPSID